MQVEQLNSEQFIQLVHNNQSEAWVEGSYSFTPLRSGIHIHGGTLYARKNMRSSQLVDSYINFIILLNGTLRFSINQDNYTISANNGSIVMVSIQEESLFSRHLIEGDYCQKVAIKGIEKWLYDYSGKDYPDIFENTVRIWEMDETIKTLSQQFLTQSESGIYSQLSREANALQLLAYLWQMFETQLTNTSHKNTLINPAKNFIQQINQVFTPDIQVSDLAARLNISERTLQRRVKAHFGLCISEWLKHKKMKYALYALKHSNLSIGEISYACGYKHVSNFTQAFKQYFHYTPTEVKY